MSDSNNLQRLTMPRPDGQAAPETTEFHLRQGQKYRRASIIIGIVGLFLFGVAAGIIAFIMARRAEAAGVNATPGKVLAVLDIIGGIIVMVIFFKNR